MITGLLMRFAMLRTLSRRGISLFREALAGTIWVAIKKGQMTTLTSDRPMVSVVMSYRHNTDNLGT